MLYAINRLVSRCHQKHKIRHPPTETRDRKAESDSSLLHPREKGECELYKEYFFKLHHLENFPDVFTQTKSLLETFLSDAVRSEYDSNSILAQEVFSPLALERFLQNELDSVTKKWQTYLSRRESGRQREMFPTATDARLWLARMAPVKLIDGAWLGHIHKITTPFANRRITKAAWQILSEELGDGDVAKNHAFVYAQLLDQAGANAISPESIDFIRQPGMDHTSVWKSAVAQLVISLFPNEYLPEILGFNLHFEMLNLETLIIAKEIREVGFNPYYFTLHVTIDNADSGHSAMASRIVSGYLLSVAAMDGEVLARQLWKRIQAGFVLSKRLSANLNDKSVNSSPSIDVMSVFRAKSAAAHRLHGDCRASFGGRSLDTWLDPASFESEEWQAAFLRCLGNTKSLIVKGDSKRSRLIHLLSWGGPMFGAFTDRETAIIRSWIDSLAPPAIQTYQHLMKSTDSKDKAPPHFMSPFHTPPRNDHLRDQRWKPLVIEMSDLKVSKFSPLWFAHPCLLENFVSIPWRTACPAGSAVVRILRAQNGFLPEPEGVAGIDEMARESPVDLVDIGFDIIKTTGVSGFTPPSLADVLERWPSAFAGIMLTTSTRPKANQWRLLGMAQAFTQLHYAVARSELLSVGKREILGQMAVREQNGLEYLTSGLENSNNDMIDFQQGFLVAMQEIQACF